MLAMRSAASTLYMASATAHARILPALRSCRQHLRAHRTSQRRGQIGVRPVLAAEDGERVENLVAVGTPVVRSVVSKPDHHIECLSVSEEQRAEPTGERDVATHGAVIHAAVGGEHEA